MHFYVDESGHTGPNLFDSEQPMLYYGVLSVREDLDTLALKRIAKMRSRLGVTNLHAAELGNRRLGEIAPDLTALVRRFGIRFHMHRVAKADHAVISFFDQVFDAGMNPAMSWTGYWTPLRYVLLIKLASLFDEELAKQAWTARITPKDSVAVPILQEVCRALRARVGRLPDKRSRQLISEALAWAEAHPKDIGYNVGRKQDMLQITPNLVGFQSVMGGIADQLRRTSSSASCIVVDRQSQFNKAQRTLAEFYRTARGVGPTSGGPGLPVVDFSHMPDAPIQFRSRFDSCGLELVDIHLWTFKRLMDQASVPVALHSFVAAHKLTATFDEVSLKAIEGRWAPWLMSLPNDSDISEGQIQQARELLRIQEERRLRHVGEAPKVGTETTSAE